MKTQHQKEADTTYLHYLHTVYISPLCQTLGWAISQHYFISSSAECVQVGELLPNFYRLRTKTPKFQYPDCISWLVGGQSKRPLWIQSSEEAVRRDI